MLLTVLQSQAAKLPFNTSARSRAFIIVAHIYALMFFNNSDTIFYAGNQYLHLIILSNPARECQKPFEMRAGNHIFFRSPL